MINVETETLVPISSAATMIPCHPPPSRATIWRWMLTGVRGRKLESIHIGGRRFTSEQAIARFLNPQSEPTTTSQNMASQRKSQDQAAMDALKKRGM